MADDPPAPAPERAPRLRRATIALLACVTLGSGLGLLGAWWWVLDLAAHFVALYLLLAAASVALSVARKWWRLAAWALGLSLLHLVRVLPLYGWTPPVPTDRPVLRVVSFNVHAGNPRAAEAARHIASLEPDVVALFEVSRLQIEAFEAALPDHEVHALPRRDPFGIAVFTRLPLRRAEVTSFGASWVPAVELHATLAGRPVAIAAVHPPPPVSGELSRARDEVIRAVTRWAEQQPEPALIVGDLNATPWSAIMRRSLRDGPLQSSQRFGLQASWPAWLGPLGLPIDHALHTPPLEVVDRKLERAFGSDHRPLVVELAVDPAT